jgi:hypothetical protein
VPEATVRWFNPCLKSIKMGVEPQLALRVIPTLRTLRAMLDDNFRSLQHDVQLSLVYDI